MSSPSFRKRLANELGITTLLSTTKDVHLLLLARCIRMFAYGSSTLILALYFTALDYSDRQLGLFMTLTLVGDVAISLALTFVADSLGRRKILILGALLMTGSGIAFATTSIYWILLLAAVVGVISPSGNEIGPFRAVEESTIAHLCEMNARSDIFAWYVVVGTLGTAGGALASGWATQALQAAGWSQLQSFRCAFWLYAVLGLVKAGINLLLSPACEAKPAPVQEEHEMAGSQEQQPMLDEDEDEDEDEQRLTPTPVSAAQSKPVNHKKTKMGIAQLSSRTRTTLTKLCALFFVDSLASGMVPSSLIALFMERKFAMPTGTLGSIISASAFVSSLGNVLASSIAKRIGLVQTMVFTHLPSAVCLAMFPLPDSLVPSVVLLVVRSSLASMDQAPRSAFLSAVVAAEERTAVMGIVNTVKTMSQSAGPLFTGWLAGSNRFWIAFVVAGALKVSYDLGFLAMFINTRLEKGSAGERGADANGQRGRRG